MAWQSALQKTFCLQMSQQMVASPFEHVHDIFF
jgi:hypothetical protein